MEEGPTIPLFFGNEKFQRALDMSIKFPVENSYLFDGVLMPLRRTLGVFGRKEMRKGNVVSEYCRKNNIDCALPLEVKFGMTAAIGEALNVQYMARMVSLEQRADLEVIIINNADILAYEPVDEYSMQFSLNLEEMAKAANWIIVGIFNRTKVEGGGGENNMYRNTFFNQFPYAAVITSPDSVFNTQFYKQMIQTFSKCYNLENTLTDDHYTSLADCSKMAAIDEMVEYCKGVFYNCLFEKHRAIDFNMFMDRKFMSANNVILTLALNAQQLDQKFTTMAGYLEAGPPAGTKVAPKRKIQFEPQVIEPLDKKLKEEEEVQEELPVGFN